MTQQSSSDDTPTEEFLRLFVAAQPQLQAFVRSLVFMPGDANDVFQETSLALWRSFEKFDRDEAFLPWAIGVARNQTLQYWRKQQKERAVLNSELMATLSDDVAAELDVANERQAALDACVEMLQPRQKGLIQSFYGANRSAGEVALDWGVGVQAVYKALKTTRRVLLECVERKLSNHGLAENGS